MTLVTQVSLADWPYLDDDAIDDVKDDLVRPVESGELAFDIALGPRPGRPRVSMRVTPSPAEAYVGDRVSSAARLVG